MMKKQMIKLNPVTLTKHLTLTTLQWTSALVIQVNLHLQSINLIVQTISQVRNLSLVIFPIFLRNLVGRILPMMLAPWVMLRLSPIAWKTWTTWTWSSWGARIIWRLGSLPPVSIRTQGITVLPSLFFTWRGNISLFYRHFNLLCHSDLGTEQLICLCAI